MVSKTREKLIDVARQLFAHKGIENTTMNDIAAASDKGRRTIYTYFKNKREIYNAVIERESDLLLKRLRNVAESDDDPETKVEKYMMVRFEMFAESMPSRTSPLKAILGRDVRRAHRIRKIALEKELILFRNVISEGVARGVFDPVQAGRLPIVGAMVVNGLDFYSIHGDFNELGITYEEARDTIVRFALDAILIKANPDIENKNNPSAPQP